MERTQAGPKHDPKALWNKYYLVRHNYFHSLSKDYIKTYGTRISGIKELDSQIEHQIIETEMNIDRMFELWRNGVSISVVNYNDTEEIYRCIHSHLITWAEYLSTGINIGDAPVKDLVELDKFAEIVYDKAVAVFSQEERQTGIASLFFKSQKINFHNVLKRSIVKDNSNVVISNGEVTHIKPPAKPGENSKHRSFKDIFVENLTVVNGWKEEH